MATTDPQHRGDSSPAHESPLPGSAQGPAEPPPTPPFAHPVATIVNQPTAAPPPSQPATPTPGATPSFQQSTAAPRQPSDTTEPPAEPPPFEPPAIVPPAFGPKPPPRRSSWDDPAIEVGPDSVPAVAAGPAPPGVNSAQPAAAPIPPTLPPDAEPDEHAEPDAGLEALIRNAPPWLISSIFHMVLVIILGLWVLTNDDDSAVDLDLTYAEDLGVQLDQNTLDMGQKDPEDVKDPVITPADLIPVENPFAAPPVAPVTLRASELTSKTPSHTPGLALLGREKGMKQALLAAYGGNATTELAVMRGLRWLARNQLKDGAWSLSGPYRDGASSTNHHAATAMALIAFQGAGYTHQSAGTSPFGEVVRRGSTWLLSQQNPGGDFFRTGDNHERLYTHALCTIALCELYGMTGDEKLAEPAQRAVDYCVKVQSPQGGWRYNPGSGSDTSVTGWFVMALQSAKMAGLKVPYETLDRVGEYLDSAASYDGSRYGYRSNSRSSLPMTAEGLLCRQYLGWAHDDPRLLSGVEHICGNLPHWDEQDVYYWYYAAQVCHHMEGEYWRKWNAVMRVLIPSKQVTDGKELGSWDPRNDEWGSRGGGRLYVTCLSIYMLEVYYRHLPIYQKEAFE